MDNIAGLVLLTVVVLLLFYEVKPLQLGSPRGPWGRSIVTGTGSRPGTDTSGSKIRRQLLLQMLAPTASQVAFDIPSLKEAKYRINQVIDVDKIAAVKFRYITVATEAIAQQCKALISSGSTDFQSLAESVSLSTEFDSPWISLASSRLNDSVDSVVAPELLNEAMHMNKGDLSVISSRSSPIAAAGVGATTDSELQTLWHLIQLVDMETKLSAKLKKRKLDNYALLNRRMPKQATYFIDTMGCQMNIADSERMEAQLLDLGYQRTPDSSTANVVVLNTCSIRDHAEQKVYSYIGPHAQRKRKNEDELAIVVAGCVAQQEGELLTRRFPEIDIVMGPQYANRLGDLLESVAEGNQVVATDPAHQMEDALRAHRNSDISAFVNIIYGCNERCTYCVVPNTRGVEQSRTKEAIVAEVRDLQSQGFREITLLGQNVDSWGREMNPKQKFADLLAAVGEVEGIERVRFLTSHPKYMSERVIKTVASNPKLMPCFNVPFQSGDNDVLRNMRRGYTRERYLEIVGNIRKHCPDAAITTDIIVGFPGETEEQFQNTLRLMEEVQFEMANTAAYSPRPNTPAAEWESQLSEDVKQNRLQTINRLANDHALNRSQRFVGRVQEVLVEDVNYRNPTQVVGRNPHSRVVYFEGNIRALRGKIVPGNNPFDLH